MSNVTLLQLAYNARRNATTYKISNYYQGIINKLEREIRASYKVIISSDDVLKRAA